MFNIIVLIICAVLIFINLKTAHTLITRYSGYKTPLVMLTLELTLYIWVILKIIQEY